MKKYKVIELQETCSACPEQYEAFVDDKQIGYLRLRHGYFAAYYPDHTGEIVYDSHTIGDGCFDESERLQELKKAKKAIWKAHKNFKK